jgi:hypothetical protein
MLFDESLALFCFFFGAEEQQKIVSVSATFAAGTLARVSSIVA